jgi:hypothetical protein
MEFSLVFRTSNIYIYTRIYVSDFPIYLQAEEIHSANGVEGSVGG